MALVDTFEAGRFGTLMKGLKDITSAWNIDISAELEAYQVELQACLDSGNVAGMVVNFAEAAMLVQGCANVYSKKVDSLHQLAFDTLTALGKDASGGSDVPKKLSKRPGVFLEDDEFRPLGLNVVPQGCNDIQDDSFGTKATIVRIPLFLIPREGTDRNRHSHRVSACELDSGGMLIFPEIFGGKSHLLAPDEGINHSEDISTSPFLLRAPPALSQRLDTDNDELQLRDDADMVTTMNIDFDEPERPHEHEAPAQVRVSPPRPSPRLSMISSSSSDEDAHERIGGLKKLRVAPVERLPTTRRLFDNAGNISLFSSSSQSHKTLMNRLPVFGARVNTKRGAAELSLRRSAMARVRAEEKNNVEIIHDGRMSQRFSVNGDIPSSDDEAPKRASVAGSAIDRNIAIDEYQEILEAQTRDYDAMIRARLEEALEGSGAGMAEHFPHLYNTVKKWQDDLEPLLEEQNSRPSFDLNSYTALILDKLRVKEGEFSNFDDLVAGEPQWNVSRLFLSGLILTNNGNINILQDDGGDEAPHESFHLRVVDADKSLAYAVESNAVPDNAPPALAAPLSASPQRPAMKKRMRRIESNQSNSDGTTDSDSSIDFGANQRAGRNRKTKTAKKK